MARSRGYLGRLDFGSLPACLRLELKSDVYDLGVAGHDHGQFAFFEDPKHRPVLG